MSDLIFWAQRRLNAHLGKSIAEDGAFGVQTRTQLETFQRSRGLQATGTLTSSTIIELRREPVTRVDSGPAPVDARPVWLLELERRQGLHEVRNRSALMAWLRSDGRTLGDPAKLPWCGDAIATCLALTLPHEPLPANPYLARNWLAFGKPTIPRVGAVLSFWRGSRTGTSGHVGLYVGDDATTFHVLGGNQSNAITVARIAKDRLLGARWPRSDNTQTSAIVAAATAPISTNEA